MCVIERINPSGEVKILDKDKYIVNDSEELDKVGMNYQGYIINLDEEDIIKLFAQHKGLVFNIDGEYAVMLKYNEKPRQNWVEADTDVEEM